jgi:hypothetical protein
MTIPPVMMANPDLYEANASLCDDPPSMMTIPTFVVDGVGMIPVEKTDKPWAYYFAHQTKNKY